MADDGLREAGSNLSRNDHSRDDCAEGRLQPGIVVHLVGPSRLVGPALAGKKPGRSLHLPRLKYPFPAKAGPTVRTPTEPGRELPDKTVQLLGGSSDRGTFRARGTCFSREDTRAFGASASPEIPFPAKAGPTVRTPTEPGRELPDKTVQLLGGQFRSRDLHTSWDRLQPGRHQGLRCICIA